jgi:hypothetical protein
MTRPAIRDHLCFTVKLCNYWLGWGPCSSYGWFFSFFLSATMSGYSLLVLTSLVFVRRCLWCLCCGQVLISQFVFVWVPAWSVTFFSMFVVFSMSNILFLFSQPLVYIWGCYTLLTFLENVGVCLVFPLALVFCWWWCFSLLPVASRILCSYTALTRRHWC